MHSEYNSILALFAIHFTAQTWSHVQVLVTGAILARGQRTVTAILRVMGLSAEQHLSITIACFIAPCGRVWQLVGPC